MPFDFERPIDRRNFLKELLLGSAVASLSLNPLTQAAFADSVKAPGYIPRYKILGRTGLKVSSLSFGAGHCLEPGVVYSALKRGMNLLETSRAYLGGSNEEMLSEVIRCFPRKQIIVLTKFTQEQDPAWITESVQLSLKALGTNYIDILMCHNINNIDYLANPGTKRALTKLKKAGVIKYCGVSTHNLGPIVKWMLKDQFYDTVMCYFNYLSPAEDINLLKAAQKSGIGIVGMKCLAGNYAGNPAVSGAAIRYALSRDFIDTVPVSIPNFQYLNENFKAAQQPFNDHDRQILKQASLDTRGLFCRSCHGCVSSCPEHLAIPDYMRGIMYATGYTDKVLAAEYLKDLKAKAATLKCLDCHACRAQCRYDIDIRKTLIEAHHLWA